jgi:hypothetical protein
MKYSISKPYQQPQGINFGFSLSKRPSSTYDLTRKHERPSSSYFTLTNAIANTL